MDSVQRLDLIGAAFFLALLGVGTLRNLMLDRLPSSSSRWSDAQDVSETSLVRLPAVEKQQQQQLLRRLQRHNDHEDEAEALKLAVRRRRLLEEVKIEAGAGGGEAEGEAAAEEETDSERQKRLMHELVEQWRERQADSDKSQIELMPNRTVREGETLGPKVPDWDEQRRDYIKKHPGSNVTRYGRPKVLMVTGSQMAVCGNDVGDFLNLKALKNKIDYTDSRDIPIYVSLTLLDRLLDSFWVKFPLVRKMMLTHPEVEWIWWIDSDAIITDMMFDIPFERYEGYDFITHGWPDAVYDKKDWVGLNAGVFLIRNSQWSLEFIDAWSSFGVKGPLRKIWGLKLTEDLVGRPVFDSDDQSVLVWMLVYQKELWSHKVYLESSYYLHGYWMILTPRYEELMDKYHPGHGDHRWPFITHFVGCKPCSKIGTLILEDMKKCVENMERAFNFADNQVLRTFGYQHLHLDTYQVVRINVTTYKASEFESHHLKKFQVGP